MIAFQSDRLQFSKLQKSDAEDIFECVSPAITKLMAWDAPDCLEDYKKLHEEMLQDKDQIPFVFRRIDNQECLGIVGVENITSQFPEIGIWLKEDAHGVGYGREAVSAAIQWVHQTLNKQYVTYPVAEQNISSRRIAEALSGKVFETRSGPKYNSVVYKIPRPPYLDHQIDFPCFRTVILVKY